MKCPNEQLKLARLHRAPLPWRWEVWAIFWGGRGAHTERRVIDVERALFYIRQFEGAEVGPAGLGGIPGQDAEDGGGDTCDEVFIEHDI